MNWLELLANLASILTAAVAAGAAVRYWSAGRTKQTRLEKYLKNEKVRTPDTPMRTVLHLMAELGMSEADIFHASFASRYVVHKVRKDKDTDLASLILFEYSDVPKAR